MNYAERIDRHGMGKQKSERTVRIPERFIRNKMIKMVGPNAYAVFSIILAHVKWSGPGKGEAWPTYNTIQELTGLHRETIASSVQKLEAYGYIYVELKRRRRIDGTEHGRLRNHYKVSHLQEPGLESKR